MRANQGRWLAGAAGALLPLGFAPFHWWPLPIAVLAALFWLGAEQPPREAAWRAFWFGFGAFAAGTYWLYISIRIFGGAPIAVALLLMLGLIGLMAAYLAAAGWSIAALRLSSPALRYCVLWPAVWTLVEWLRGWLFSGFPWLSLGYGQIDGPLQAFAPLLGVYGLSWITATLAGAGLTLLTGAPRARAAAALWLAIIAAANWGLAGRAWTVSGTREVEVALVQGSIPQDRKWLPEQLGPTLELYRDLTFALDGVELVVWPEVAIPAIAGQVAGYLDDITARARERNMQILLGVLTLDAQNEQIRNSLLSLGNTNGSYHKRHLVPFGEFFPVPDFIREGMRLMSLPYKDTSAGRRDQPPLRAGDLQLAPSICYEDAFGAEQIDFLPAADVLVNVSNDAWFGDSIAPHQHLQIARMRALETGRYMLRATNTGITAVISPFGAVIEASPQFRPHVLRATVVPHRGATPYVRFGNWPVVIGCTVVLGVLLLRRRLV